MKREAKNLIWINGRWRWVVTSIARAHPSPQSSAKGRLMATEWAIRLVTDVQRLCGLEGSYIPPGHAPRVLSWSHL